MELTCYSWILISFCYSHSPKYEGQIQMWASLGEVLIVGSKSIKNAESFLRDCAVLIQLSL